MREKNQVEIPWVGVPAGPRPDAGDDEQSFDTFLRAFDDAPVGMLLLRPDGSLARANRLILHYVGESHASMIAADRGSHTHPEDRAGVLEALRRLREHEAASAFAPVRVRNAQGGHLNFDCVFNGIYRTDGSLRVIVAHMIDVTALRSAEVSLEQQRQRDPRSGALLEQAFEQHLGDAVRIGDPATRWFVLAAGFDPGEVKARLGNGAKTPWEGRLADCFRGELPRGALLGERGPGVFLCAVPLRNEAQASDLTQRISAALERALYAGEPRRPPLRFGAAPIAAAEDAAGPITEALFALERAVGADAAPVWADEALKRARRRRAWIADRLPDALRNHELRVHYQPIVDLASTALRAGEALARWPGAEPVSPAEFIPVAEQTGLLADLDQWVAQTAIGEWADRMPRAACQLHLNASARTMEQPGYAERILAFCKYRQFETARLVIELTESSRIADAQAVRETVRRLKAEGVLFAVDDFGAGNAWFDTVSGFDPQIVKLDMQFARRLGTTVGNRLAAAAIATGQAVGAQVIVEGVERAGQAAIFRQFGADSAQGFLYGAGVALDDFLQRV